MSRGKADGPLALLLAQAAQQAFMAELWRDAVGFMGAVMIRRIVGIAHVAEMKTIEDSDIRWGWPAGRHRAQAQ